MTIARQIKILREVVAGMMKPEDGHSPTRGKGKGAVYIRTFCFPRASEALLFCFFLFWKNAGFHLTEAQLDSRERCTILWMQ